MNRFREYSDLEGLSQSFGRLARTSSRTREARKIQKSSLNSTALDQASSTGVQFLFALFAVDLISVVNSRPASKFEPMPFGAFF